MSSFQAISLLYLVINLYEEIETNLGVELIFILLINCQDRYKIENPSDSEILTIEMTKRKNKILVGGIYKPPNLNENHFTTNPETIINKLSNKYEKSILMVDFNVTTTA